MSALTLRQRWQYSLKLASWPKLFVPMLLGGALGVHAEARHGTLEPARATVIALALALLALCNVATIVWLNDYADQRVDALKRTLLPQAGSPKTIFDGLLSARALLIAGVAAASLTVALAAWLTWWTSRTLPLAGATLGLAVFAAYSLPPLRLNYRGGGELLEGFGVGVLYPLIGYWAHAGRSWDPELWLVLALAPLALASAVASGLSDEESDRAGGKRTVVTWLGNSRARLIVGWMMLASVLSLPCAALLLHGVPVWVALAPVVVLVLMGSRVRRLSPLATTGAFAEQARYKQALHHAIWLASLTLSLGLVSRVVSIVRA